MNEKEKELMKHFKVEELEERLEMKAKWTLSIKVNSDGTGSAGGSVTIS